MAIKNRKKGNQPKVWIGGIFNDGGGLVISIDVWGRPHIKRIPPWQPDVERLALASNLLAQAEKLTSRQTRKQLRDLAEQFVKDAVPAIQSRLNKAG